MNIAFSPSVNDFKSPSSFGIAFHGALLPDFKDIITLAYGRLPPETRKFLEDCPGRIAVADYKTRVRPDLANVKWPKTRDDPRTHANHSHGTYYADTKDIIVAQLYLDEDFDGVIYSSPQKAPAYWHLNTRPDKTLRHEIAHKIDDALDTISNSLDFQRHWKRDVDAFGGEEAARQQGFGYYIQDGRQGRKEVLAVSWDRKHDDAPRHPSSRNVSERFKYCDMWMTEFLGLFPAAVRAGPTAIKHLVRGYQYVTKVSRGKAAHEVTRLRASRKLSALYPRDYFKVGIDLCQRLMDMDIPDTWGTAVLLAKDTASDNTRTSNRRHVHSILRCGNFDKNGELRNEIERFYGLRNTHAQQGLHTS